MFDPHADPHGKGLYGTNGTKECRRPHPLEQNGRKALKIKGWKAPNQLVRMRSPVQIRIAAPQNNRFSIEKAGVFFLQLFLPV